MLLQTIYYYLNILHKKIMFKKNTYSFNSLDLLLMFIFKNKKKGFYIDIGCNHPIKYNNTYLFYKKGWSGINIDLDIKNINLFNFARPRDKNIACAISSKNTKKKLYYYHDKSAINTLDKSTASYQKAKVREIKTINTKTLNSVLHSLKIKNKIDFISIDVEGHELDVVKGINFKKYKPSIVVIEFLDLSTKKLEIKNLNIKNTLKSKIYKYMQKNEYTLVNYVHSDLVFAHKKFRD